MPPAAFWQFAVRQEAVRLHRFDERKYHQLLKRGFSFWLWTLDSELTNEHGF